jgi:hypothetical protein
MRRYHQHLVRCEVEELGNLEVGLAVGLIAPHEFGREDAIPRQPGVLARKIRGIPRRAERDDTMPVDYVRVHQR